MVTPPEVTAADRAMAERIAQDYHVGLRFHMDLVDAIATALATVRAEWKARWRECYDDLRYMNEWRNKHMDEHPYERNVETLQARVAALEDLVRRMRDAQRRYYKSREQTVLIESKRLEREVDHALGGDHGAL